MLKHKQLLLQNKAWRQELNEVDPNYFNEMAEGQSPSFLWIGCSDSRVSPTEITQSRPGEMFIHRNIANMVVENDLNLLSVTEYAVKVLKVRHVIICGHYGCGGVKAALLNQSVGLIDKWLEYIKRVHRKHAHAIDAQKTEEEKINCMVEFNVREQLRNLAQTDIIQSEWKERQDLFLHGWVYDLNVGLIKPLEELDSKASLELPAAA